MLTSKIAKVEKFFQICQNERNSLILKLNFRWKMTETNNEEARVYFACLLFLKPYKTISDLFIYL